MQEIIIDEKFRRLLPFLDDLAYSWLEENLLVHGCLNPLVLWNDILIDGHHRYEIIKKHDLPYRTISLEFDSREEVVVWIISTQISRRNLTPLQLSHYRGMHYNTQKKIISNESGQNQHNEVGGQNDHQPQFARTSDELSEIYNVSPKTIRRDAQVSKGIIAIGEYSLQAKELILAGKTSISRKQLQALATASDEAIRETSERILDGTHVGRQLRSAAEDYPSDTSEPYARHHPDGSRSTPSYSDTGDEQLSLDSFITKIIDDFTHGVKNLNLEEDAANSKSKLRLYIDMLEELYSRI